MLNAVYRLVAPRRFEVEFNDIDLYGNQMVVRPTHLSICHADQRYYQGTRPAEVMKRKLPMALIHEGIGEVVHDPTGTYQVGDTVIMIPNIPAGEDTVIAENYLLDSRFRASSFDGFMQEHVVMAPDRAVPLLPGTDRVVAAFTELVSVSVHSIRRFDRFAHTRRDIIGVWGDGNLGFLTALCIRVMQPESRLYIFGVDSGKLAQFSFADAVFLVSDVPEDVLVDHAFECVGGQASQHAIEQMIDHVQPEGTLSLMGVSEYPVPINTRMVLEKGLRFYGSSRSGREDFLETVEIYRKHPEIVRHFSNIVGARMPIHSIEDMNRAFELDISRGMGKTVMMWDV